MAKIIKHFVTNITPTGKNHTHVFETKAKPVVTNDFIHLELILEDGITSKGFNLREVAEYSIRMVEE
ncbi:TPA: hypothetical protein ACHYPN_004511 [Yersinia enterocolitica]|nr:hypothetical protein [Yersinia enterocolitica]HDM8309126.1 hypothetical protein [Yersinia enterocolitica]HDU2653763.1 hypothetical protein [Yersinia enterocolitica]HDV7140082.1 hypothetical protein [Yersinia enterocolitica]HDW3097558.1 hypothetical protein [Yersinia enterocolitica]